MVRGEGLSRRQREVLELAARGAEQEETARVLGISPDAVKLHRRRARTRTGARTTTQAVATALMRGWINHGDAA